MANVRPIRIPGRWREGYVLDYHTLGSTYLGDDEYGHPMFDTKRSDVGELLYRLKYRSDSAVLEELVDANAEQSMTKVFIGGSRRVLRLNADVRRRIDRIIEQGFPVLVGDANGADKAVQKYLQSCGYEAVEVFCSGGECRNNLGRWPVRAVATRQTRRDFDYYAAKDEQMAQEASVGLMIWDGQSAGTLANAARLLRQDKKVVVYATPAKRFLTLRAEADWEHLVSTCGRDVREKILRSMPGTRQQSSENKVGLL